MSVALESSEAAILDRVFNPEAADWLPEEAAAVLEIGFSPADRERMTRLLKKAKTGALTPTEVGALESYRHIGRLLELMKSRARRSLKDKQAA